MGEVERKSQSDDCKDERPSPLPEQRQQRDQQVSSDADGGYWNWADHGKSAMIHNSTVPMRVDVAGFRFGGVMHLPSKR